MKYLFFLIILLVPIGLAHAEVGKNFDTENLGNGLVKWTSHYDRVFDGTNWQNYILTDNANEIKFDSAGISFSFDKANCDFKLYDPITKNLVINSYQTDIAVDGKLKPKSICNVIDFTQTDDLIDFTIDRDEFKILYDLDPVKGMEWTYEIINTKGKTSTFTITEACQDCIVESIDGNLIDFGSYTLDTKNEKHNTVKDTRSENGDYIIEYEKVIADNEKLVIDPIFTSNNPSEDAEIRDADNDNNCEAVPGSITFLDAQTQVGRYDTASVVDCGRSYFEYDITTIPDASTIMDVDFGFAITSIAGTPANCDYVGMAAQPTVTTDATNWANIGSGTALLTNDSTCPTSGNNKSVDLGTAGNSYILGKLSGNWAAIGIKATGDVGVTDATNHITDFCNEEDACTPDPTLTIFYLEHIPNKVTDLHAVDIRGTAVDLAWTTPNLNGGVLSGYQINKTTPWNSNVATVVVNNTNSSSTAYTARNLTGETQYSFRVGVWETEGGSKNMSGNVLNVTTDFDPTESFTPGTFNITGSGTDLREIFYSRTDINSTALWLNVTATHTIELNCNFYYKFAMTNDTFTNIANVSVSSTRDMASFKFLRVDNEIIDVLCWDQDDNQTNAKYLITQLHFPLQDQIENFRNGTYGTAGQFGSFDMITIFIIIISMVGFNRVNEVVGVILSAVTIGIMAWFGLIQWYTILTTGIAIAIFWAWSTHKSD